MTKGAKICQIRIMILYQLYKKHTHEMMVYNFRNVYLLNKSQEVICKDSN